MSRTIYSAVTCCWMLAALPTVLFARGFAGVPAQESPGLPGRGFLGFPAGGVGGFAGGHMYGMHAVGMPGRNEFDTLYPVTLPNLGAAGRLQPYGLPPMGVYGDFHPGGLPGMGGYAGLHPVAMPDVFDTGGVRMGGTVTGDGGAARQASHPVPPGGFETGRLRTDLPVASASTNTDELQSFTAANRFAGLPAEQARAANAANRGIRLPTDAGLHAADGTPTGQEIAPRPTDVAATRPPQFEPAPGIEQGRAGEQRHLAGTNRTTVGHGLVGSWLAVAEGDNNTSSPNQATTLSVNQWFVDHAVFTPAWCETHAWAWCPAAADSADWTRTAWTVASWETAAQWLAWAVIETGLFNLTRDAARIWVHFGAVETSPRLMIRVPTTR